MGREVLLIVRTVLRGDLLARSVVIDCVGLVLLSETPPF